MALRLQKGRNQMKNVRHSIPEQRKLAVSSPHGGFVLRVTHRAERRLSKQSIQGPSMLVRCGCCGESVKIDYGNDDNLVEINGVIASREEWAKILGPLLKI